MPPITHPSPATTPTVCAKCQHFTPIAEKPLKGIKEIAVFTDGDDSPASVSAAYRLAETLRTPIHKRVTGPWLLYPSSWVEYVSAAEEHRQYRSIGERLSLRCNQPDCPYRRA